MVRGLDDEGARLLQAAAHLDVRAGVHDRVGDQLADDDQGVGGEVLGQLFRAGQAELGPVGERGPHISRAAPGASELPSRVSAPRTSWAYASAVCAGAPLARETVSRCVGMAPMDGSPGSSCEYFAVDADRVTDRARP